MQCDFTPSRVSFLSNALVTNIETEVVEILQKVWRHCILANLGDGYNVYKLIKNNFRSKRNEDMCTYV